MTGLTALLHDVQTGRRAVDELSPDEVERLVVHAIQQEFGKTCQVEDCTGKGGPIDVIVRCQHREGRGVLRNVMSFERTTYVECKHYRRKLELDTVAKVFVVAVINKPNELVIVASSELAPQARLCADYLFAKRPTGVERTTPLSPPQSVTSTLFHLRRIEDILGVPRALQKSIVPTVPRPEWSMTEETPFWTTAVDVGQVPVRLSHSSRYQVTVRAAESREPASFRGVRLDVMDRTRVRAVVRCEASYDGRAKSIAFSLPLSKLPATDQAHAFRLVLVTEWSRLNAGEEERTPLFKYLLHRAVPEFGDLRKRTNEAIATAFTGDSEKRVLTVHGEGGSGKTWLGNLIAERLRRNERANCQVVVIDEATSVEVLRTIAWGVMMPSLPMPAGGADLLSFSHSWAKASSDGPLEKISEECLAELLTLESQSPDDVEGQCNVDRLAHALCVLLVRCPVPTLVVFRDCHRASFGLTQALKHLFRHLATGGWGKTRIVLEFREGDEATDNWRQFLETNIPRVASVVVDAALRPVSADDIAASLGSIIVGEQAIPLAYTLHRKTGGNPLLVRHLLLYFRQSGFLVPAGAADTRLRIEGFGDIERELGDEIEQPDDVLPIRIRKLVGKTPNHVRSVVVSYLAGASFSGLHFDESVFRRCCACSPTRLKQARQTLLDAEIIGQSFEQSGFAFVHEFMRAAVKTVITRRPDFATHGERLLDALPRTEISACLVGGELLLALRRPADAYAWFDAGQEQAKASGALLVRERCLSGANTALLAIKSASTDLLRKQSAVGLELAATLTQTGSQIRALQVLLRLRQMLDTPSGRRALPVSERNLAKVSTTRHRLTLLVRLMKAEEFFGEFNAVLTDRMEIVDFHYALTRFILMAIHCNQPFVAWHAVPFAMRSCAATGDENTRASLYSDIGRLYLQAAPEVACRYWTKAVSIATARRESSHAKLNVLVSNLHGRDGHWSEGRIFDLEADIEEQGVANQLCRLWNCRGIVALAAGRRSAAAEFFERALIRAQSADQPYWQWKSHNNFAVSLFQHGERQRALSHLETALSLVSSFEAVARRSADTLLRPLASALTEYGLERSPEGLLHPTPPPFSGLFPVARFNYDLLSGAKTSPRRESNSDWSYPSSNQPLLWSNVGRDKLALAIE